MNTSTQRSSTECFRASNKSDRGAVTEAIKGVLRGGGTLGGSGPSAVPADIPDGRDDDIVARQLREAAMKETDPELRERLWEEYRQYKTSTQ